MVARPQRAPIKGWAAHLVVRFSGSKRGAGIYVLTYVIYVLTYVKFEIRISIWEKPPCLMHVCIFLVKLYARGYLRVSD